jgi:hypothetical protein
MTLGTFVLGIIGIAIQAPYPGIEL